MPRFFLTLLVAFFLSIPAATAEDIAASTAEVIVAEAAPQTGEPAVRIFNAEPWQLNFQPPQSPIAHKLDGLHDFLLIIIFAVSIFVLLLMIYIIVRFNRRANPTPATFTHNVKIEFIWTVIPIIILVVIAIPSVRTHYFMEENVDTEMTLKVVGRQWYWQYEYPDHGGFGFDSYMLSDEEALAAGEPRLLGVDNRVVVPVNTNIRVQMTGGDVIHAWAIPALGVKRDAVPGRLNEIWFEAESEGIYYGQCSELCGKLHGFMPIALEVVSQEKFADWVAGQQKEAGIEMKPTDEVTQAEKEI